MEWEECIHHPSFLEIRDYQSDLDGLRLTAGRMGGDSES